MTPFILSHSTKADLRELSDTEVDFVTGAGGGDMDVMPVDPGTFTRTYRDGAWHDDGIQDDGGHGPI